MDFEPVNLPCSLRNDPTVKLRWGDGGSNTPGGADESHLMEHDFLRLRPC